MIELLHGDCREMVETLADESVQTIVTSPPYWGLRKYTDDPREIGNEPTPAAYVAALVDVFDRCWRVLRDDGTLWLNLGDSYGRGTNAHKAVTEAGGYGAPTAIMPAKNLLGMPWRVAFALQDAGWILRSEIIWHKTNPMPESVGDRPTRNHEHLFLFAKQPRYFYDAAAIAEPAIATTNRGGANKYQEQVTEPGALNDGFAERWQPTERPQSQRALELFREKGLTQAHLDAIRAVGMADTGKNKITMTGSGRNAADVQRLADEAKAALGGYYREFLSSHTRNKRTVWSLASQPYAEAHFATFPEKLVEPCILAGSSAQACEHCGAAWGRVVERESNWQARKAAGGTAGNVGTSDTYQNGVHGAGMSHDLGPVAVRDLGFAPRCACAANTGSARSVVLDPFGGSGTVGRVAERYGRDAVLIELSAAYLDLQAKRTDKVQVEMFV